LAQIISRDGRRKTVITTRWPVVISNNALATVSIIDYEASSRIRGKNRYFETRLLDKEGSPTSLPISVKGGESTKLFIVMPIHIIDSVYALVRDVPEFSGSFTPAALDAYLNKSHETDLYGNKLCYARKTAGSGEDRLPAWYFVYHQDGTLDETGMQADQVTVEFKTAKGGCFLARALYYDDDIPFRPRPVTQIPQGATQVKGRLTITEGIDSLPKTE